MTAKGTSYAIEQKLHPYLQLSLIIIAATCSSEFTLEMATNAIKRFTAIEPEQVIAIVYTLGNLGHIVNADNAGFYSVVEPEVSVPQTSSASNKRKSDGYVYLIQADNGAYKIGRTMNPDSRYQTFKATLPFVVEYVCVIATPDMFQLESDLHTMFAEKRLNGEWFDLTPEDVSYIKSLGVQNG